MSTLIVVAVIGVTVAAVATVVAAGMMLRDARARRNHPSKKDAAPSGWLPLMLTCLALTMLVGFTEQLVIALQRGSLDVLGAVALTISGAAAIITGFVAVIVTVTWRAREKRADIPQ
jgi:amino acid transporter